VYKRQRGLGDVYKRQALDKLRKDEKLQSSYLQNQIDNIEELLYSTKYKLVNHQ
jgi:hypothetical protein